MAHDFDPPCVADRHADVHGSDANIAHDTTSGLAANTGKGHMARRSRWNMVPQGSVVNQGVKASAEHAQGQSARGRPSR